jgi:hypothetical protein
MMHGGPSEIKRGSQGAFMLDARDSGVQRGNRFSPIPGFHRAWINRLSKSEFDRFDHSPMPIRCDPSGCERAHDRGVGLLLKKLDLLII